MGRAHPILASLVIAAMFLAGCTGTSDGDDGDEDGDPGSNLPFNPLEPGGGSEDGKATTSNVAPPAEQKVEDCNEVDRPGEYCMRNWSPRSERKFAAPIWKAGYQWRYSMSVPIAYGNSGYCDMDHLNKVTGTGKSQDLNVFFVTQVQYKCDGSVNRENEKNITRADLMQLLDDGYIEHEMLFPLEDGKRWFYQRNGDNEVTVEAKMEYEPNFKYSGSLLPVSAWHITLTFSEGGIVFHKWFGEGAQNYLYEEIWAELEGQDTLVAKITLENYKLG